MYYDKGFGSKLFPNLYVMLIGPSGLGKGMAIGKAFKMTQKIPEFHGYRGRATIQFLFDQMDQKGGRLYLVTPELSMGIGTGSQAEDFIRVMTELYEGGEYIFFEGTRTSGSRAIKNPIINWLSGSTMEWLIDTVSRNAILSGFFARCIPVAGHYDFARRIHTPRLPGDHDAQLEWLSRRLSLIVKIEGVFTMDNDAKAADEYWYNTRESPEDELMAPTWKRAHDQVLKVAMLLALCGDRWDDLKILQEHVLRAQTLVGKVHAAIPKLMAAAIRTSDTEGAHLAMAFIQKKKCVTRSQLIKVLHHHGIGAQKFERDVLPYIAASAQIGIEREARTTVFTWKTREIGDLQDDGC